MSHSKLSVADKIANRLGYTRISSRGNNYPSMSVSTPDEKIATKVIPPHLLRESSFDYGLVDYDLPSSSEDGIYFYETDDCFHYAIGRHNWMPLMLAGFIIGMNSDDGEKLFSDHIAHRLHLPADTQEHASWLSANQKTIDQFNRMNEEIEDAGMINPFNYVDYVDYEQATVFEPKMFCRLSTNAVSAELKTMWRRNSPLKVTWLSTTHAHNLLVSLPIMHDARSAPKAAFSQLLAWTEDWFASRGFQVNRKEKLVNVHDYQPLFYVDTGPGTF